MRKRTFPEPIKLASRCYWLASEVQAWIDRHAAARAAARPTPTYFAEDLEPDVERIARQPLATWTGQVPLRLAHLGAVAQGVDHGRVHNRHRGARVPEAGDVAEAQRTVEAGLDPDLSLSGVEPGRPHVVLPGASRPASCRSTRWRRP